MAEYIRAVEAAEKVAGIFKVPMADLVDIFSEIPAADVAPVVHGHKVDDGGFYARCSQCDGVLTLCANYCPNCGAKMDGGADNA